MQSFDQIFVVDYLALRFVMVAALITNKRVLDQTLLACAYLLTFMLHLPASGIQMHLIIYLNGISP